MTTGLLMWVFAASTMASLLFSALSYALRTLSRVQLEEALVVRRRTRAMETILSARHDLALTCGVVRLVFNTTGIIAMGGVFLERYHENPDPWKVFGWTVLVTVPVMLVFSVAIPQAWAKYAGEPLLALTWPLLRLMHWLLWPLVRVLKVFDEMVKRLAGVSISDEPETAAEKVGEEILSMVAEGRAEGAVDEEQKKMIEGVISFRDLQVSQIMTPRTEMVAVEIDAPLSEVRDKILRDGLSRIPVYEKTLDNVVGILYAKDLLTYIGAMDTGAASGSPGGAAAWMGGEGGGSIIDLRRIQRPALFVPRTKPLRDLLREFRLQQVHMAVVLDEYGGTSGLVTTEDIVEEIVGNIADEYEPPEPSALRRLDERTVEVDARMHVSEINRTLELGLPENSDYQTIGGFVVASLGMIPARGHTLTHEGITLTVLDAEPRRVKRLRLDLPAPAEPSSTDSPNDAPSLSAADHRR